MDKWAPFLESQKVAILGGVKTLASHERRFKIRHIFIASERLARNRATRVMNNEELLYKRMIVAISVPIRVEVPRLLWS